MEKNLFEGYVLEIGDKWIDVQNTKEGVPWRFYLPWVGGYRAQVEGMMKKSWNLYESMNPLRLSFLNGSTNCDQEL